MRTWTRQALIQATNPKLLVAATLIGLGGSGLTLGTLDAKVTARPGLAALDLMGASQESVHHPVWAGVFALVVGGLVMISPSRRA